MKVKRRTGRILSVVLSVALLLSMLPTDTWGGISEVKAATAYTLGTGYSQDPSWSTSENADYALQRVTTWGLSAQDFNDTLEVGDTIDGISAVSGTVKINGSKQISIAKGAISIPLDESTVAVKVEFQLPNKNNKRSVVIGSNTTESISHNQNNSPGVTANDTVYEYSNTYKKSDGYFSGTTLSLSSITSDDSDSGETKFNYIKITEYKNADDNGGNGSEGEDGEDETESFTAECNFTTETPTVKENNTATSYADSRFASTGYRNDDQHGYAIGNTKNITIKVKKGSGTVTIGGCTYSNSNTFNVAAPEGVTITGADGNALTTLDATSAVCYYKDSSNTVDENASTYGFKYECTADEATITLTATGTIYVPYIKVEGTQPKTPEPEVTEVNATITIDDASVLGDATLTLTNANDATDTHTITSAGGTFTAKVNATYNITSSNSELDATVNGNSYLKTSTTAVEATIKVTSKVVNATVELAEGSALASGKKLTITKEGDENSTDLTVGGTVKLTIGKKYTVATDDDSVEARVGDSATFEAKADTNKITVSLLSKTNTVKMTVKGVALGNAKVVMTNKDDSNDKLEFVDGAEIELKLNATYTISCTDTEIFAKIEDKTEYTVASKIEALTVTLTKAEYHTYDVWDFGAEQLVSDTYNKYNNKLTVDDINGLYSGVTAGTEGKNIASFVLGDLSFNDGGFPTSHRWRTTNTALTRYDSKSKTDATKKTTYTGYIYSNKGSTDTVYLAIKAKAGDIFTIYAGSNSSAAEYGWAYVDDSTGSVTEEATADFEAVGYVEPLTFYATKDGTYRLYSTNEKMVVARIYRETPTSVTVSGNVTAPAGANLNGTTLVFTQLKQDGTKLRDIEATISNGKYSVQLQEQYSYTVSLKGISGYIVDTTSLDDGKLTLVNGAGNTTLNINTVAVTLVSVKGSLADLTASDAANLELTFKSDNVYVPEVTISGNSFTGSFEKGVEYSVSAEGVEDYTLDTTTFKADADGTQNIKFTKKPTYAVNVTLDGPSAADASKVKLTFTRLKEDEKDGSIDGTTDGYTYSFTGTSNVSLRDGQYQVKAELDGYEQQPTADVKVKGGAVDLTIKMKSTTAQTVAYKDTITVGASGRDYTTINDALEAVRNMNRTSSQRVTIAIDPGNYEEMLVVDVDNVTLKNASSNPSTALKNSGVDIDDNAVRITSYYGHGYSYYSMGADYKWSADALEANKQNGYNSVTNPGSGTATMWNATVVINADGFQADGIIFENSFNQYVSAKAAADTIVKESGAKEGTAARATMAAGSTAVQNKKYVERAAALAIGNAYSDIVFDNCKFIGRQDTLYGGTSTYAEFNNCSVYGGTDYIFGGMTAIFNKCDLVFNTTDDSNDIGYITAAQQKSGRGYLMYECHITSVVPGVDVDSTYCTGGSKPGYFGRPWAANTSEVVFYNTTIDASKATGYEGQSLIAAEGWNNSLSGESSGMCEYGTVESAGVDNSASRVSWATALTGTNPKLADGTYVTLDAFRKTASQEGLYNVDLTKGLYAGVDYDGGISVLADMPYKTDGFVQGSANPANDAGKNPEGAVPVSGSVLKLVAQADGRLKVKLKSADGKTIYFVDETDDSKSSNFTSNATEVKVYNVEAGHTYYLYGGGTKIAMYSLSVDYRPSVDWDTVSVPTLGTPTATNIGDADEGQITIPYAAQIGSVYSDSLDIIVFCNGEQVDTISITDETDALKGYESSCVYKPTASGTYTFQGLLKRSGEQNKSSEVSSAVSFNLPMEAPEIVTVENTGSGSVKFSWKQVNEAETYDVTVTDASGNVVYTTNTTKLYDRISGLTVGQKYTFGVVAIGNNDRSEMSTMKQTISEEAKKTWQYTRYGSSTNTKTDCGVTVGSDSNNPVEGVSVWSLNGKGKLVPNSTDGITFYYTTIDPETENFTFSADVTVDNWTYSNGQEGFGLMVSDTIGADGDSSAVWNNSYMATVTKVEYYWDDSTETVSDSGTKYTMKLGVGAQEKIGVTKENIEGMADGSRTSEFSSTMTTLETSAVALQKQQVNNGELDKLEGGTFNIVGGATKSVEGTISETKTFHLTIQRNNTGYIISYTDENGQTQSKTYYHGDDGDELTKLDENNIYLGIFASRNAKVTVNNVSLTTINPANDAPAEERPITYVTTSVGFESAKISNSQEYELVYYGNVSGTLNITCDSGTLVDAIHVDANTKYRFNTYVFPGYYSFYGELTPDEDYTPSKYERMTSYDTQTFTLKVSYFNLGRNVIYVSPDGNPNGDGSKESPMSIDWAVKYVRAGDQIILMEGTYNLYNTITIDRGIDGTADEPIQMIADPEATSRPVLNFNRSSSGMIIAGDYWYLQGFDVTNTADGQKGIQVSGSNNTLDNIWTYKNGNTGIQIARYKSTDLWEDWPANNLILNCTSFLNADSGYEDADGFAAKLTIAEGNTFDGCISAFNADDGWDCFAKVETGPIGKVTIKNSVAFMNGYILDDNGNLIDAGNGNGFKMGGESLTGYHTLINSVAFANKAKGIDSNSCPDIQVYNSTSYNNESYNVAFYTNNAKNTDFLADGIISYKDSNNVAEQLKPVGTQTIDQSNIYKENNYFFTGSKSTNTKKVAVTADWFKSLDTDAAIAGFLAYINGQNGSGICRNADGTINMNGYLVLTDAAPSNSGARLEGNGTASAVISVKDIIYRNSSDDDDDDDVTVASGTATEGTIASSIPKKTGSSTKKPVTTDKTTTEKPATTTTEKPAVTTEKTSTDNGETPYIVGEEGKTGWDVVKSKVEKAKAGETVNIVMNGSKSLPSDILESIKGQDVTISFDMGNGVVWSINGKTITSDKLGDIDFSVELNTNNVPSDLVKAIAGDNYSFQISLAHDGEFGFDAVLSMNVDAKNAGKYANLFYYNPSAGSLEFISADQVAADGNVNLTFKHASDYVVVIADSVLGDVTGGTTDVVVQSTGNNIIPVILGILAVLIIAGIAVIVVLKKKDKVEGE